MSWHVANQLRPFLRRPRLDLVLIAGVSAIAGLFEAAVLILVVNAAVAIADGTAGAPIDLPIIGVDASIGQVLWCAAGLTIVVALAIIPPIAHMLMPASKRAGAASAGGRGRLFAGARIGFNYVLAAGVAVVLAGTWAPLGPEHPFANLVVTFGVLGGLSDRGVGIDDERSEQLVATGEVPIDRR